MITFAKLDCQNGTLNMHARNKYHHNAVDSGKIFLRTYLFPGKDIINQVCSQRVQQIKDNRERLRPIIESLIFCGRQNITLRGHRDDGSLIDIDRDDNNASITSNEGNFRELLRLRIRSGD